MTVSGHRKGICRLSVTRACKTTFLRKKKNTEMLWIKKFQWLLELVVVGDLCAFAASAGRFKIGQVMQFVKYDKNNKELQYKGNNANIVGIFGVLCIYMV